MSLLVGLFGPTSGFLGSGLRPLRCFLRLTDRFLGGCLGLANGLFGCRLVIHPFLALRRGSG